MFVLFSGPSGVQLDFSFNFRALDSTLDELGRALLNIVTVSNIEIHIFVK